LSIGLTANLSLKFTVADWLIEKFIGLLIQKNFTEIVNKFMIDPHRTRLNINVGDTGSNHV